MNLMKKIISCKVVSERLKNYPIDTYKTRVLLSPRFRRRCLNRKSLRKVFWKITELKLLMLEVIQYGDREFAVKNGMCHR